MNRKIAGFRQFQKHARFQLVLQVTDNNMTPLFLARRRSCGSSQAGSALRCLQHIVRSAVLHRKQLLVLFRALLLRVVLYCCLILLVSRALIRRTLRSPFASIAMSTTGTSRGEAAIQSRVRGGLGGRLDGVVLWHLILKYLVREFVVGPGRQENETAELKMGMLCRM